MVSPIRSLQGVFVVAEHALNVRLTALRSDRAASSMDMRSAFASNPRRFADFSLIVDDLLLDWSKCAVSTVTMSLLEALAREAHVTERRDAMFRGEKINATEK